MTKAFNPLEKIKKKSIFGGFHSHIQALSNSVVLYSAEMTGQCCSMESRD